MGARWSSNGVYREPAFTTSEANRQVSSAFCPTEGLSLSLPLCCSLLPPSPTASSAESPSTLHCLPRWAMLARVLFCLSLMCANVQQDPFFCQGTFETTDSDRDNSSCQAGGGYIPMWLWGKKGRKSKRKTPSAVTAFHDSQSSHWCVYVLFCSLCINTFNSYCSLRGGVEKHTTFLHPPLFPPRSTSKWCKTIASESDGNLL